MDFIGKDALIKVKADGVSRRLRPLLLEDGTAIALGGEPVRMQTRIVGRVSSGGYGYTIDRSIAYAYLPSAQSAPGTHAEVQVFGRWVAATVAREPLYDPAGERIRS
jgi:4-methylaminobutanoate oxidase (formaldehyde-forming)